MGFLSKLFGPSVPNITATELSEKMKFGKHPLVLDVRQPDEFRQGHIRGAKLMPLNELYKRMGELPKGARSFAFAPRAIAVVPLQRYWQRKVLKSSTRRAA
jgi:rhodanese-related sulfurtransferase